MSYCLMYIVIFIFVSDNDEEYRIVGGPNAPIKVSMMDCVHNS